MFGWSVLIPHTTGLGIGNVEVVNGYEDVIHAQNHTYTHRCQYIYTQYTHMYDDFIPENELQKSEL